MKLRFEWFWLAAALGLVGLPGCNLFHGGIFDRHGRDNPNSGDSSETVRSDSADGKGSSSGPPSDKGDGSATDAATTVKTGELETHPPVQPKKADQEAPPVPTVDSIASPSVAVEQIVPMAAAQAEPPTKRWPLVEAMQCILDERHQEAVRHLQAYDAETQEFYLRILPTLTVFARKRIHELSAQEVGVLNDQLQSLQATLRPWTELVIDRMCYCKWVKHYGIYQPLAEGYAFVGPTPNRPGELVQMYVEVRNVASVARGKYFETRLSSSLEIRDVRGVKVWSYAFDDAKKPLESLARLNDYCNTYTFQVPDLPPGVYRLVLQIAQIADESVPDARRVAQKSLEFRVTALAARAQ